MNSRERTLMALHHEEPDRPPVSATYTPEVAAMLRAEYGYDGEDLGYAMGNDLIKTAVGMEMSYYLYPTETYTCKFGVEWKNVKNETGAYTEIIGGALMDDEDGTKLAAYRIPDPDEPTQYEPLRENVRRYGKEKFIVGSCQCSIFETAWYLHGIEATLMDMIVNEDYANALFDRIMEFPLKAGLNMIDMGADMIWLGDDIATQQNMMMSLPMWRKFFKTRYAQVFSAFKKRNPNIYIAYHSCGNCQETFDDFIEIGLNVINPIQPLAMDPYSIKQRYGDKLTLFGAVDVQMLLPFGTADQVTATVRDYKRRLGAGGGYILSPAHHIQSDTSMDNIKAFYAAALEPSGCERD